MMENFKTLKQEFEDLEFEVFRSGKYRPCFKKAVDYRVRIWKEKFDRVPFLIRLFNWSEVNSMRVRLISLQNI